MLVTPANLPGTNAASGCPSANNSFAASPPHKITSRPPSSTHSRSAPIRALSAASSRAQCTIANRQHQHIDGIVTKPSRGQFANVLQLYCAFELRVRQLHRDSEMPRSNQMASRPNRTSNSPVAGRSVRAARSSRVAPGLKLRSINDRSHRFAIQPRIRPPIRPTCMLSGIVAGESGDELAGHRARRPSLERRRCRWP